MSFQGKVIAKHNSLPLRMHATPFLEARVVSKLPVGVIVDIEAVEGSWMCVYDRATGNTGWVQRDYIQELPPPQPDVLGAPSGDVVIDTAIRNAWIWTGGLILFFIVFALCIVGWIT